LERGVKVTVFGSGYVGLVQAACLAEVGHEVLCVEINAERVALLSGGRVPIYEPDLEPMVRRNLKENRLAFTTDASRGVAHGSVIFIAVGTPPQDGGGADLQYVNVVADTVAAGMDAAKTVVVKSTVPVGTADAIGERIRAALSAKGRDPALLDIVSNPEFLKEGSAVADAMKPDRIIVGTTSPAAEALLRRLYAPFNRNHETILVMDARSAELTKYAANAMLATKISFMNEMANLAEALGADVEKVRRGIGADPRIGYQFIYPGIGYGGSCFPKDVSALIHMARQNGVDPVVLAGVDARNASQKLALVHKMERHFVGKLSGRTFALWGLSFKPNTDDMRDAPARTIMEALWAKGARVQAYDPVAIDECRRLYGARADLTLASSKEEALTGADGLIIATEWKAFQSIDLEAVRKALEEPVVFDGRNIYDPALAAEAGLIYYGIGRGR
jgi:UDPglucose 6-dehydrogenase